MQSSISCAAGENVASTERATVTFISVMHMLNKKHSLEAKPQEGCSQKLSTGLLVLKSRVNSAGLGSKLLLPKTCQWRSKELMNNCNTRGLGSCRLRTSCCFLCQRHIGFRVWWFLTHWAKLVPNAASSMTADLLTSQMNWSTVLPEIQYSWNAGGEGSNLLFATGMLKFVAQFS